MEWLDKELRQGRLPKEEELLGAVEQELAIPDQTRPGPKYGWCGVAAALLNDLPRWRRVVKHMVDRDYFYYRRQRDAGVDRYDLGPFPTFEIFSKALLEQTKALLAQIEPGLAAELGRRLQSFGEAGERSA